MFTDAIDSFLQIFSPPFRSVMVRSLALTAAVLVLVGYGLDRLALWLIPLGPHWLATIVSLVIAIGLVAGMVFLAAPTASLVASFYLDDISAIVEREVDPTGPTGVPAPALQGAIFGLRFAALSLLVNLLALALLFVPGVGLASFFLANGYLLGREYFELAAMRYRSPLNARALRRDNTLRVFAYGAVIAAFVAVPLLNLFTPLFAAAMMARLNKRLSGRITPA